MDSTAKTVNYCDCCKSTIKLPEKKVKSKDKEPAPLPPQPMPLAATFVDSIGNEEDCHFCDEGCLRTYLNDRSSKASVTYELDIETNTVKRTIKLI